MITCVGLFDHSNGFDADRLLAELPELERGRYRTLLRPRQAAQYLASRWLLRTHLARELGVKPIAVPLQDNAAGPPMLPGTDLHLSLSHSGALCLCIASSWTRVGCDVERCRPRRQMQRIAAQFFHLKEAAHLSALDEARATADFYRLWTLKEAGRKALGQGIGGGLRAPAFTLRPTFQCLQSTDRSPWTFAVGAYGHPGDRYSLALALNALQQPDLFLIHRYTPGHSPVKAPLSIDWNIATTSGEATRSCSTARY